ncbi:sigma-54-dependent Fis family transcriptional regulator [candidate division FCPU426 bacterium]|nr:sigma-54-dependent Fis family transcriptional regulator [candidate division FCPU426 bacterium]
MARILILEDKINVVDMLKGIFEDEGYIVDYSLSAEEVMGKISSFGPDLITLDISFSDEKDTIGIAILEQIRQAYPSKEELPVIVISGTLDAPKMKRLLELGINDYFRKPIDDNEKLIEKIKNSLSSVMVDKTFPEGDDIWMVGESPKIVEIMMDISNAAQFQSDLLIMGATGTGKEVVAKIYHQLSPRKDKPLVAIECTSIPKELFETIIFGYEPGAHSMAAKLKPGRIEGAKGGIVFFDEIGELTLDHQSKLLRLLQERTFCRVGSNKEEPLDAIILAATNRPLWQRVKEGKFREDLYFRLKSNYIELPPLRERLEDIPILCEHFIKKYNAKKKKRIVGLANDVLNKFKTYLWKGNVRELEKCIECGFTNCKGDVIKLPDVERFFQDGIFKEEDVSLPAFDKNMKYDDFKKFLKSLTDKVESAYYSHHLQVNHNNKTQTADFLGIKRQMLSQILERLGLL